MASLISLPESLTIQTIESSFNELNLAVSDSGDDIVLDAQALENIDTSGLQCLLVIIQKARQDQKNIQWQNANNSSLVESAKKIGLSEALQLN